MGFRGGNGPFGAHLPPRLRLGGKYGPSRPLLPPQTLEKRSFTAGKRFLTEKCRTKYQFLRLGFYERNKTFGPFYEASEVANKIFQQKRHFWRA